MRLHCKHPDRHISSLKCGYPLPCPFHTVEIDLSERIPKISVPITRNVTRSEYETLREVAVVLET